MTEDNIGMLRHAVCVTLLKKEIERLRRSRVAVILLVYSALVLDNMLLTVVVPIIPDYLYQLEHDHVIRNPPPTNTTPTLLLPPPPPPCSPQQPAEPTSSSLPQASLFTPSGASFGIGSHPLARQPRFLRVQRMRHPQSRRQQQELLRLLKNPEDRPTLDGSDLNHRYLENSEGVSHSQRYEDREGRETERVGKKEGTEGRYIERDENNQGTKVEGDHRKVPLHKSLLTDEEHQDKEDLPQSEEIPQPGRPLPSATMTNSFRQEPQPSAPPPLQQEAPRAEGDNVKPSTDKGIIAENGRVGLLYSSKALVQLLVNPLVGPLTAHVGYSLPLVVGTHNLILSALLFAYAQSYGLLFLARSLQGVASSCIAISGMGMIAESYPEDGERGRMQGLVMGGIALGVLVGYPLGGFLYDFTSSKTPPFLLVAALAALLAAVQLAVFNIRPTPKRLVVTTPLHQLLRDPYILVTSGAVMVSTAAMAVLEPCLPIWLTDTLHPQTWQLGMVFIPDSLGYLVSTSFTAGPAYRLGRWRVALVAMLVISLATATVPEARSMVALAGPHILLGVGVGTVDAALMPLLAAIVDARHVAAYGAVYSIAQAAVALAYFLGPLVGGAVVQTIGFPWLMRIMAILNLCYCPVLFFLKSFDQETGETQAILMAAPKPHDYTSHITTIVQPREASLRYQQLFDEEED